MIYRKHKNDLLVDWALLGERGWEIDATGAEAAYLDPTETMGCHLDRTTLDIILCGSGDWCAARLRDLADAGVPGLELLRSWQTRISNVSANLAPVLVLDYGRRAK